MRHAFLLTLLACALAAAGCARRATPGRPAPDFSVTLKSGQKVDLASYHGRVLVLNFWASWCPPCVEETPALNKMAEQFPNHKVVVLGISIDEDPVAYQTFLTHYGIEYPTARDPSQDIMHRYGTVQIPETYVIGPNGHVRRKLVSVADFTAPTMIDYLRNLANGGS